MKKALRKLLGVPSNSILIRPGYGLGNRLLALSSALALGRQLDRQVLLIWIPDHHTGACFQSLFELADSRCSMPGGIGRQLLRIGKIGDCFYRGIADRRRYFDWRTSDMGVEEQPKYDCAYVLSWSLFYPSKLADLSYLRPVPRIRNRIERMKEKMCADYLVGVHIRRGDSPYTLRSPTRTFEEYMQREADNNEAVKFFVASDSEEEKVNMRKLFGKRVITYDAHLSRCDTAGIMDAVVDLYLLAEARKIIASDPSTYSQQASLLKGAPLYYVDGDQIFKYEHPPFHPLPD